MLEESPIVSEVMYLYKSHGLLKWTRDFSTMTFVCKQLVCLYTELNRKQIKKISLCRASLW